ncbi:MAG: DUF4340 domain-containing protein [Proteobacteria bacterium]|jgi:hypothetical protein|nr:DUF4340 domain-containing protein [Pseudomonadota bacterium]
MNKTTLISLSVAILVMLAVVLVLENNETETTNQLFVPDMGTNLDDINRVEIRNHTDQLVMRRHTNGEWLLEQAQNYFVDVDRLTVFLRTIAAAQTVEEKTAKPEYYPRLGVEDIVADGASVEVGLFWSNQNNRILFGNAQGEYRYARVADQPTAWLIDADLDFSLDVRNWLASELVNIMETDVLEVSIEHSDGESITVVRGEDGAYQTDDVPEGRELKYSAIVNSFGTALFNLDFDQVRPASNSEADAVTTFQLSDSVRVVFSRVLANKEDDNEDAANWFRIQLASTEGQTTVLSATEIEALRKATEGWEFKLSDYKADQIVQRMEDLLSAEE